MILFKILFNLVSINSQLINLFFHDIILTRNYIQLVFYLQKFLSDLIFLPFNHNLTFLLIFFYLPLALIYFFPEGIQLIFHIF